jgi:hypothetical protein
MAKFNSDLIDDLARRRVVLFIGAGASKWSKPHGGGKFKDWVEFLEAANARLERRSRAKRVVADLIESRDYLLASELLKQHLGDAWSDLLSEEFQQAAEVSRLHKALIALDPRIIITTNFDKLIESAWSAGTDSRYPTVITRIDANAFKLFRNDEKHLIKLHGSVDTPSDIVFDKTSYQTGAFGNSYYSEILSSLLLTHTFLFVGFSMNDPAVSLVIENAAYRFPSTRPHYIFQSGAPVPEVDELWKRLRRLYVLRYPEKDHHVALAEHLEQLGGEAAKRKAELIAAVRVGTTK